MAIFDTNDPDVAAERLRDARKGIQDLRRWIDEMDAQMERILSPSSSGEQEIKREEMWNGFPISWASTMMERALIVYNEIARCNGAVLVRSKK